MTQETGTKQENQEEHVMAVFQKGSNLQINLDFQHDTNRKIWGLASMEKVDRENEVILMDGFRNALPNFMKHPILHHQHTERPVGTVTKAEVTDKGLYIEASIYDTEENNDIWSDILSGKLNKFSVFGKRKLSSPECRLRPGDRKTPCITKSLDLYSISVVGDNAINEASFLEVVKAFEKAEDTGSPLMHTVTDGKRMEDEKKEETSVEKGNELIKEESNMSSILERIKGMEDTLAKLVESDKQVHNEMGKAEDEMEDKKEEVEKCNTPVEKAEPVVADEELNIVKAKLTEYETVVKAFGDKFTELEARIKKIEDEPIHKGDVVILGDEVVKANPMLKSIEALYKR